MSESKIDVTLDMARRIKGERKRLKLSQDEMSSKLDMSEKNYGRIERAEQGTYLRNIKKMAEIFGVDAEYLLCNPQHPYRNEQDRIESERKEREEVFAAYREWDSEMEKLKAQNDFPWISGACKDGIRENMAITCNAYPVKDLIEYIVRNGGYNLILDGLRVASEYIG